MRAQTCFPPPVEHYCAHFPYKPSAPSLTGTLPDTSKRFSKQSPSLRSTRFLNAQTTTPRSSNLFPSPKPMPLTGHWLGWRHGPSPHTPATLAVQVPSVAREEERVLFCFCFVFLPRRSGHPASDGLRRQRLAPTAFRLGPVKGPVKGWLAIAPAVGVPRP